MKKNRLFIFFATVTFLFICMAPFLSKGQEQPGNPTFVNAAEIMTNDSYVAKLALDLKPTIFINENDMFLYGNSNFLVLESPYSKISQLYTEEEIFSTVQLIRIRITEGSDFTLDLENLQSFPQLRYVWLMFLYDACENGTDGCLLEKTQNIINSGNEDITIIYSLSISQE